MACIIALGIGGIKPSLVIRWGGEEKKNRKNVFKVYGSGTVGIFFFIGLFGDKLADFFVYTFMACIVLLVIGLIKPSLVIRWGKEDKRNRKYVLMFYSIGLVLSFILIGMSDQFDESQPAAGNTAVESGQNVDGEEPEKTEEEKAAKEAEEKAEEVGYELKAYKDFVSKLLDIYNMYEEVWMTTSLNDLNKNQEFNEDALSTINTIASKLEILPLTESQQKEFKEYSDKLRQAQERYAKFDEYTRYTLEAGDSFWDDLIFSDMSMEEVALLKAEEYFANK